MSNWSSPMPLDEGVERVEIAAIDEGGAEGALDLEDSHVLADGEAGDDLLGPLGVAHQDLDDLDAIVLAVEVVDRLVGHRLGVRVVLGRVERDDREAAALLGRRSGAARARRVVAHTAGVQREACYGGARDAEEGAP